MPYTATQKTDSCPHKVNTVKGCARTVHSLSQDCAQATHDNIVVRPKMTMSDNIVELAANLRPLTHLVMYDTTINV
jgi:hypothetical protein